MPSLTDPVDRKQVASIAGTTGWLNTPDRGARMAPVRANSPAALEWHAKQLGIDLHTCTDEQRKRVETARTLYYKRLSRKGRLAKLAKKAGRTARQQAVAEALGTLHEGTAAS